MAVNPLKALLFASGASVAVVGAAYFSGALDPLFKPAPQPQVAAAPAPPAAPEAAGAAPGTQARLPAAPAPGTATMKPAAPADGGAMKPAAETPTPQPSAPAPTPTPTPTPAPAPAAAVVAPTFDVVRVEGDGSVVVAGNAAPGARVEVIHGATVLGSAVAGPDGTFAIVLDDPLKPGDYQLVLRATTPDNVAATSEQTAIVSVPDKPEGQVLAMVEAPGKPAELLSVPQPGKTPQPEKTAENEKTPEPAPGGGEVAGQAPPAEPAAGQAVQPPAPEAAPAPAPTSPEPAKPVAGPSVVVEAVEIDGGRIFVAGIADPGRRLRAYANDMLLGDAKAAPDGHFLVEAVRDLPVGEYTIRVDALDADGSKVVARAAVPFQREPGESMAAVAPSAPPAPAAAEAPAPSASETAAAPAPAEVPAAPSAIPETVSPKLEHADGAVIIRRGDSLWRISRRVYGHGIRYSTIYLANQDQIRDPDRIWPGQVFKVPEKSREGEAADMKALGNQATTSPPEPERQQ